MPKGPVACVGHWGSSRRALWDGCGFRSLNNQHSSLGSVPNIGVSFGQMLAYSESIPLVINELIITFTS